MAELTRASDVVLEVTGYRDIHPGVLLSIVESGGYVSAAYEGDRLVATLYGIVGVRAGDQYLHSEMLAVLPTHRALGLARLLKLDQRSFALEQGMALVTWTFDPLRGPNANLNIRRLGAEVVGYVPDMYGSLPGFSGGWPTDQLFMEWRVSSPAVEEVVAGADIDGRFDLGDLPEVIHVSERDDGLEEFVGWTPSVDRDALLLRVPQNAQEMRARDMDAVLRWRLGVREAFLHYLGAGYRVEWFIPERGALARNVYVLSSRPR